MNKSSHNLGGFREGAGRPHGTGKYGEASKAIRIPVSLIPKVESLLKKNLIINKKDF